MRHRLPPDTRLHWDDPDLPFFNSKGKPVPADRAQAGFAILVETQYTPSWRNDPTYNLRRKRT